MSLPINVEDLILERVFQSTRLDYKKEFDPNAVIHSICAFANDIDNTGDGYIIIGIEEKNERSSNIKITTYGRKI